MACIDRIKLYTITSEYNENQIIIHNLINNGAKIKNVHSKECTYQKIYLNCHNFAVEFIPVFGYLSVIFNPLNFMGYTNYGTYSYNYLANVVRKLQKNVISATGIDLDLLPFYVSYVELRNDYIINPRKISKNEFINCLSKLQKNIKSELLSFKENGRMYGFKIKGKSCNLNAYDKGKELLSKKNIKLLNPVDLNRINYSVRIEFQVRSRKLRSILKNDKLTLQELLNPYTVNFIYKKLLFSYGLSGMFLSKNKQVGYIAKYKNISYRVKKNLIEFVKYTNYYGLKLSKIKYKSSYYNYKNILSRMGINVISFENCSNTFLYTFLYSYRAKNIRLLLQFFKKYTDKINIYNKVYNIYTLLFIYNYLCINTKT